MFITVHSVIGVAAVSVLRVQHPIAGLLLGWILHYITDVVPHGDEKIGDWCWRGLHPIRRLGAIFTLDFCLAALGLCGLSYFLNLNWVIFATVLGSMIPDMLLGAELALGHKQSLSVFSRFHNAAHKFFGIRYPLVYGLIFQIFLLVLMSAIIFRSSFL
jgi:hypothetical protein